MIYFTKYYLILITRNIAKLYIKMYTKKRILRIVKISKSH